jgi:drug/metabolite transporter (DMT)-like permease
LPFQGGFPPKVFVLKENGNLITYAGLILAVIFWGFSFVATKIALESIPVFTLIFIRFFLSSIFFGLLILKNGFPRFSSEGRRLVFLTAIFEPVLYFIFETNGLQYTSAPKASLIIATIPLLVLVLASFVLKERSKRAGFFGIFISLFGIWFLITGARDFSWDFHGSLIGDLLIFGAVFSAAIYIICARYLGKKYSSLEITTMQTLYGTIFFAVPFFWEFPEVQWSLMSGRSIMALGYLTIFATIAAYLFYNHALTKIPAARAAVFINGIPLVTIAGAWFFLEETLTILQAGGGFLVLAAIFITSFPDLKEAGTRIKPVKVVK